MNQFAAGEPNESLPLVSLGELQHYDPDEPRPVAVDLGPVHLTDAGQIAFGVAPPASQGTVNVLLSGLGVKHLMIVPSDDVRLTLLKQTTDDLAPGRSLHSVLIGHLRSGGQAQVTTTLRHDGGE